MPSLYIVATPIGNLEDITFRALRVLKNVRLIAAEDTRTTRKLLSHYDIHTPLTSYHNHNKVQKIPVIIKALEEGDVALVSDAGTPGISDPGLELVRAAVESEVSVVSIPGPSAVITALAASGMYAEHFLFLGFPSRRKGERRELLKSVAKLPYTIVLFEAPHRLRRTLSDLQEVLGNRSMAAVREATKLYEEVFRGTVSQCLNYFSQPRGEFTLIVDGRPKGETPSPLEAEERLRALLKQELSSREAREQVASETGFQRREIYRMWLKVREGAEN
ncbi:16S rRNA (cytidine(1402)-2'-O)-methyltransferase [SAR202 cluster bacterium AC-647-N09_OGT_505m]|nr:16S rRNA (cytidine(1402)-2'-O)-methyltransferase [SAR202 cluster bacterium AC-647-N09_OGT_505m]